MITTLMFASIYVCFFGLCYIQTLISKRVKRLEERALITPMGKELVVPIEEFESALHKLRANETLAFRYDFPTNSVLIRKSLKEN